MPRSPVDRPAGSVFHEVHPGLQGVPGGIEVDESLLAVVRDEESLEDDPVAFLPEADAFEREVDAVIQEWGALLDRDAAAMIVVERHVRSVASFQRIADLEEGMEANLRATVTAITPIRTFTRQDGTSGRVVNLELRDESGFCRFVLWA